jgi:ABC-2 type transport system ATP-binding protein
MRRLLRTLAQNGITVFVSSHQLSEVEQFASHVGVLHQGRLRFQGSLDSLRARHGAHLHLRCDDALRAAHLLMSAGETVGDAGLDTLSVKLRQRSEGQINRLLVEAGITVSHLAREQLSLEDLFFDMTREHQRNQAEAAV